MADFFLSNYRMNIYLILSTIALKAYRGGSLPNRPKPFGSIRFHWLLLYP